MAVIVAAGGVTSEVVAREGEVRLPVALPVVPDPPRHRRPRMLDREQALDAVTLQLLALRVKKHRLYPEEGPHRGARLLRPAFGWERSDRDSAGLGLPPRVRDGAIRVADDLVVPLPGLRIDGLADRAQKAQRGAVVTGDELVAHAHQGADGRGRRVQMGHLVLLHDLPQPAGVRVAGDTLEDDLGDADHHRTVGDVRVPGDPAAVRRAKPDVAGIRLDVEDVLEGGVGADHVAARGVHDALGRPCGPGGVQDEERVLRPDPEGVALRLLRGNQVVPQHVALDIVLDGHHLLPKALEHDHAAHHQRGHPFLGCDFAGLVRDVVQVDRLVAPHDSVAGDDHERPRIHQAVRERARREAAEDHRVHRAYPRAREHRERQLRDHGHEERDAVGGLHAEGLQRVRDAADLLEGLRIRVRLGLRRRLVLVGVVPLGDEGDAVPVPGRHVPVQRVVGDVGVAVLEPLGRRVEPLRGVPIIVQDQLRIRRGDPLPVKLHRRDVVPEGPRPLHRLRVHLLVLLEALEVPRAVVGEVGRRDVNRGRRRVVGDGGGPHGRGLPPGAHLPRGQQRHARRGDAP
mmetsp:Transcript_5521/g.16322  ORF Transcript_5521/g.16322 Transcript_5521/m.16322 type:complete len:572 (+) Transcript_5521:391-2106(+)